MSGARMFGNYHRINESFDDGAASKEDLTPEKTSINEQSIESRPSEETTSCFDRFLNKSKNPMKEGLIQSMSQSENLGPSKETSKTSKNAKFSYYNLKARNRITYTKLKEKTVLNEFRNSGEMITTSEVIKTFLNHLEPASYRQSTSFKTGFYEPNNGVNGEDGILTVIGYNKEETGCFIYSKDRLENSNESKEVAKWMSEALELSLITKENIHKPKLSQLAKSFVLKEKPLNEWKFLDIQKINDSIFILFIQNDCLCLGEVQENHRKVIFEYKVTENIKLGIFIFKKYLILLSPDNSKSRVYILKFEDIENEGNIITKNILDKCRSVLVESRTSTMAYVEEKQVLVTGTKDGEIFFYDTTIKGRKFNLTAHSYSVSKVILMNNEKLISLGSDKSIKIINIPKQLDRQKIITDSADLIGMTLQNLRFEKLYSKVENEKLPTEPKASQQLANDPTKLDHKLTAICIIVKPVFSSTKGEEYYYWCAFNNRDIVIHKKPPELPFVDKENLSAESIQAINGYPIIYTIKCTNGVSMYLESLKSQNLSNVSEHSVKNDLVLSCTILGIVNCYSSLTFTKLFTIKLHGPVEKILLKDGFIYYSQFSEAKQSEEKKQGSTPKETAENRLVFKYELKVREVLPIYYSPEEESSIPGATTEQEAERKKKEEERIQILKKERAVEELKDISIIGPNESDFYKVCNYISEILNDKQPEFNPEYDKWIILPYLISPIHLYANKNMPVHIARSLYTGSNLNESTERQSALTIAVAKDYEECVMLIMKNLKFKIMENPYFIDFLDDTELIEMNFNGRKSLSLFYNLMLTKVNQRDIKRFAREEAKLPLRKSFNYIVTDFSKDFRELFTTKTSEPTTLKNQDGGTKANLLENPEENKYQGKNDQEFKDCRKPIVFMRSLFKISQTQGEKRSIDLIRSFIECQNLEIFQSPFVKAYIDMKFDNAKYFIWFEVLTYLFYLILLSLYILFDNISSALVIIPLLVGMILSIMELFRLWAFGMNYVKDYWNILNFIRAILFYTFLGYTLKEDIEGKSVRSMDSINYPLLLLVLLSSIKGILMFRLFDNTRYFLHLLQNVIVSSFSFMMVLIYVLIVISLILLQASLYSENIGFFLGHSFLIVTGALDPTAEKYNIGEWITFLVAVVLLTWIMMNLLVAIYNDAFSTVYNYAEIYNYKTKAWMAYESERISYMFNKIVDRIFCQRNPKYRSDTNDVRYSELSYLYMVDKKAWNEEKDPVLAKVSKSKADIRGTISVIDEIEQNVHKIARINKKLNKELNDINKSQNNEDKKHVDKGTLALKLFRELVFDALEPTPDYSQKRVEEIGDLLKKTMKV